MIVAVKFLNGYRVQDKADNAMNSQQACCTIDEREEIFVVLEDIYDAFRIDKNLN